MMFTGSKKYRWVALLLATCLLTLTQCKRSEEPFNNIGQPVFALKGTINGQNFSKTAGVNGYYMYSSYDYDTTNQAFNFSAVMAADSCPTCKESLQITFYDKTTNNGSGQINIAAALATGGYEFYNSQPIFKTRYKYTFIAEGRNYTAPNYLWIINATDTFKTANPVVFFTDTTTKDVCLTITDNSTLCQKTICNNINFPSSTVYDFVKPNFNYDTTAGLGINFIDLSTRPSGTTYLWNFGDGNQSIDSIPSHTYTNPGRYLVNLTISGIFGSKSIQKNISVKETGNDCLANFSYESPVADSVFSSVPSPLSKILVRYVDASGEEFLSYSQSQPSTSQFTVLASQPYQNNERGEKTRSLTVNFKCRVYSTTTGAFKDVIITDGVIAVAYP
jgi:PKD repeat protein